MLGDLEPDPADLSTADGRPATREAARDRLARMVGTDREGLSADDAFQFARAADRCLIARLERAAERACRQTIGQPEAAVIAGSGDFLARRLAPCLVETGASIISLKEAWGPVASSAGCAFALVTLATERFRDRPIPSGDERTGSSPEDHPA